MDMSSQKSLGCEGVLVISCGGISPKQIILQILGEQTLPDPVVSHNLNGYRWRFKTKYYSAETIMYAVDKESELDSEFCETIKAVILYFDSQAESSFSDVLSWKPLLKDIDAEVQLLMCDQCQESERKKIQNWCVENQHELVELSSPPESDGEEGTLFESSKGYSRIIEALQSHTWANLVMNGEKPDSQDISEETSHLAMNEPGACESLDKDAKNVTSTSKGDGSKKVAVNNDELHLEEKLLNNVLNGEDPGGESFEALFSKFASMKDRATGLTGDDRKKYAEKVAVAFWRAMGGDEDEIDGLDGLED